MLSPAAPALYLLVLCLAAYAPLITRLGFYWDDFPISWIAATMGGEGLERYFSTNRPVWGMIYRLTTPLLGSTPLVWQVAALLLRWASGLALYWLVRLVWPQRKLLAAWAAALFVVYPGFSQQFIAFLYSHFYLVLIAYLLSLALMILALRRPRWFWPLTAGSLLLSVLNLFSMEYFFLLDLLRPLLIWIVLSERRATRSQQLRQVLIHWLPYLGVFAAAVFWRTFLFGFQTYQPSLMTQMKAQPLQTLFELVPLVLRDVWMTSAGAWQKAFTLPDVAMIGERNLQRYWLLIAASAAVSLVFLVLYHHAAPGKRRIGALQPAGIGLLALLIAGGPFWLTGLPLGLVFPNDRFTLPFMLGASLVIAGLLDMLPLPHPARVMLLSLGIGFAVGLQFSHAVSYTRDWNVQRNMFWQMTWRIPDLKPGTILLINELPVTHYTDNSLTAPLNWTYDPHNDPLTLKYVLFYPTLRKEAALADLQPGQPVELDYLAATFHGSTDQMVTLYYNPPGCLRVVDPEIEAGNWMVPMSLRETLLRSSTAPILPGPLEGKPVPTPPAHIYGDEIPRGWCYYFERADLARQLDDWETVAQLGDAAFASGDYPNDPVERFPFIEGYAHTGNWERAVELSRDVRAITPVLRPALCRLWNRIDQSTEPGLNQQQSLQIMRAEFECMQVED